MILALLAGAVTSSRGLTNEDGVSLQGDMPRYLMNGVFLRDALVSGHGSIAGLYEYAQRYYARYPALSLGHHPPLLPVLLVPFYAVFGVSVAAARLAILCCFLAAIVFLFLLTRRYYDELVAGWASLLFATVPIMGAFSQQVLAEVPAIALVLLTLLLLARFRESGRTADYLYFVCSACASLFARQTAVYMFPAYLILLVWRGGLVNLRRSGPSLVTLGGVVLFGLAGILTLFLSPFNSDVVFQSVSRGLNPWTLVEVVRTIFREHPTPWLLATAGLGVVLAIGRRDRRVVPAVIWICSVVACLVFLTGTVEPARYSVVALPALAVIGASIAVHHTPTLLQRAGSLLLVVAVSGQLWTGQGMAPVGASGYEAAAEYVLEQGGAPTVMYSSSVDTGYFVFFVRKHDDERRLVVLRSDKILTTSLMAELSVEDHISTAAEIEPILKRFGTRFIVLEDRPSGSNVLDWLREVTRTDRFAERRRFATESGDPRLAGVSLVVYEYLFAQPPDPTAELDLHLPLVEREIRMPLSDLIAQPAG